MKDKLKKKLKKVVPFILIAVLSCTAVLFSYDKGNEVQAAVVVDDIMVVTTILALCGVSLACCYWVVLFVFYSASLDSCY